MGKQAGNACKGGSATCCWTMNPFETTVAAAI